MKPGIHPDYHPVMFQDATTGTTFLTRSDRTIDWPDGATYPLIVADVTNASHPHWTGTARLLDAAGRVEKFERKYGRRRP